MAYKMVVCPESAQPELIEYEEHPLGILTRGCSRFRPACELSCGRSCASQLDPPDRMAEPRSLEVEIEVDLVVDDVYDDDQTTVTER